ncbi:MAG: glucose 1-dehydrogenase [Rhodospirillaceae bacterium]
MAPGRRRQHQRADRDAQRGTDEDRHRSGHQLARRRGRTEHGHAAGEPGIGRGPGRPGRPATCGFTCFHRGEYAWPARPFPAHATSAPGRRFGNWAQPREGMQNGIDLSGQVAVVTGASSGIGRACALTLAAAGARVVVNYRGNAAGAAAVAERIAADGRQAMVAQADVSDEAAVAAMFRDVRARFGTVHILVNNAGIEDEAPFVDTSAASWRRVIDVNLTGQFLCAREAAKAFLNRAGAPGHSAAAGKIVCMSSVHQRIPWARHAAYAASKGGVKLLVETLAQELAPQRIRVNGVAPGAIRTDINRSVWETEAAMRQLLTMIGYGRIGEPDDVAKAVLWLASDESDYVTGTTLFVDGGMHLYPAFSRGQG